MYSHRIYHGRYDKFVFNAFDQFRTMTPIDVVDILVVALYHLPCYGKL